MKAILALFSLLRVGSELANAATWKNRAAAAAAVAALLGTFMSLLRLMGVHVPVVSDADIGALGEGIAAIGGVAVSLLLAATNKDVGLPAKPSAADVERMEHGGAPVPASGAASGEGHAADDAREALQRVRAADPDAGAFTDHGA